MLYENLPLYPGMEPPCGRDACMRMKLFGGCGGPRREPPDCRPPAPCETVWIENPCCPGERAEVALGVDECGNLTVCVRRGPRDACRRKPRGGCAGSCDPCRGGKRPHCDRCDRPVRPDRFDWEDRCRDPWR